MDYTTREVIDYTECFHQSDWARNIRDKKSTSGGVFYL